jgi:alpha-beta hydrolase superfamily lysophospholipase
MIPVTFHGLLGKLHRPDASRASGLGVVLVPPHGVEALAATKSLRILAESLAERGHAVLRFDLPGTADSLGSDSDPGRLDAWVGAARAAASFLVAKGGASGIVMGGLRFGAAIATLAATGCESFAGLMLLDPVVKGRIYARELALTARALAEGARLDPDATTTEDGLLIAGLTTTNETLAAIRTVDLGRQAPPEVPTLVLHRPGAADAMSLASSWPARPNVAIESIGGFEAISLSPTMATTPHEVIARAGDWLDSLPKRTPRPAEPLEPARLSAPGYTEEALVFGEADRLFGVLCEPSVPAEGKPALIIVNAGRNSHVGWARSGVLLARELAAQGVASLRMDLAGIGDGRDRPGAPDTVDAVLYHPANASQVTAGVDLIAARGYRELTMLGACSGAYLALHHAAADPRIGGLILVNIQRFVWRPGETVEEAIASAYPLAASYAGKVFEARAWKRILTGERKVLPLVRAFSRRLGQRVAAIRPSEQTRQARLIMRTLSQRRVAMDLIFSENDAGLGDLALHFGSGGRWLLREGIPPITVVPAADHDMTPPEARRTLVERVSALVGRRGAARGSDAA